MVEITTVFRNQNYHHHSWTKPIFGSSRGEIHSWELGWTKLIDKTSWEKKLMNKALFLKKSIVTLHNHWLNHSKKSE